MKCPGCGNLESKVVDSRLAKDGLMIRRRRECEKCQRRYTTYERVEEVLPMVVKKDGRREQFDRMKVLLGVKKACEKRPVSIDQIEKLVAEVEQWAEEAGDSEVQATQLGERVMERLHNLDEVAYVRFASVYRSFKDLNEFMDELKDVLSKR